MTSISWKQIKTSFLPQQTWTFSLSGSNEAVKYIFDTVKNVFIFPLDLCLKRSDRAFYNCLIIWNMYVWQNSKNRSNVWSSDPAVYFCSGFTQIKHRQMPVGFIFLMYCCLFTPAYACWLFLRFVYCINLFSDATTGQSGILTFQLHWGLMQKNQRNKSTPNVSKWILMINISPTTNVKTSSVSSWRFHKNVLIFQQL